MIYFCWTGGECIDPRSYWEALALIYCKIQYVSDFLWSIVLIYIRLYYIFVIIWQKYDFMPIKAILNWHKDDKIGRSLDGP